MADISTIKDLPFDELQAKIKELNQDDLSSLSQAIARDADNITKQIKSIEEEIDKLNRLMISAKYTPGMSQGPVNKVAENLEAKKISTGVPNVSPRDLISGKDTKTAIEELKNLADEHKKLAQDTLSDTKIKLGEVNNTLKTNEKITADATSTIAKFGAGLVIISKVAKYLKLALNSLMTAMKEMSNAAIDATEVQNKFEQVFAKSGGDILLRQGQIILASEAVAELSDNFGMATVTAKKLLANTGDLFSGLELTEAQTLKWSKVVVKLATDLTSFQNIEGGVQAATEALTKGMLGETENLKKLGIVVRKDSKEFEAMVKAMKKQYNATDRQAEAFAILAMSIQQSPKALDDFSRTAAETANSIRVLNEWITELKITIGTTIVKFFKINEGVKTFTFFIKSLIEFFKNLGPTQTKIIGGLIAGFIALTTVLITFAGALAVVIAVKAGLAAAGMTLGAALTAVALPLGIILGALLAVTGAVLLSIAIFGEGATYTDKLNDSFNAFSETLANLPKLMGSVKQAFYTMMMWLTAGQSKTIGKLGLEELTTLSAPTAAEKKAFKDQVDARKRAMEEARKAQAAQRLPFDMQMAGQAAQFGTADALRIIRGAEMTDPNVALNQQQNEKLQELINIITRLGGDQATVSIAG